MDKTLADVLVDRLIEATCRAVKAEDELEEAKKDKNLFMNGCDRRDTEIAALKKQVQNLEAKLASYEGLEEADRGVL